MSTTTETPRKTVEANCELHGPYIAEYYRSIRSLFNPSEPEALTACPICHEEERKEAEEQERLAQERFTISVLRGKANIPPRFRDCSFDNYVATTPAQQRALVTARGFAENFRKAFEGGHNLTFCGMCVTGKTHLAAAVMNDVLDSQWSALYTTVHELIRDIRGTWRRHSDEDESDVLERYRKTSLLVLDEVGASLGGEAEQSQLFDLLDWRYRNMKPNLIISNLNEKGLQQCLGDRLYDRLTEIGSAVVTFNWKSERQLGRARRDLQQSADSGDGAAEVQGAGEREETTPVADERSGTWVVDPDSGESLWVAE